MDDPELEEIRKQRLAQLQSKFKVIVLPILGCFSKSRYCREIMQKEMLAKKKNKQD